MVTLTITRDEASHLRSALNLFVAALAPQLPSTPAIGIVDMSDMTDAEIEDYNAHRYSQATATNVLVLIMAQGVLVGLSGQTRPFMGLCAQRGGTQMQWEGQGAEAHALAQLLIVVNAAIEATAPSTDGYDTRSLQVMQRIVQSVTSWLLDQNHPLA